MITKLTKEQINKFPFYRDKWLKIGLDTTPFTLEEARPLVYGGYDILKEKHPEFIIIMSNPLTTWLAVYLLNKEQQVRQQVEQRVGQQVRQQVGQRVEQQIWQQIWQQVGQQVEQQVVQQVRRQVEQQVGQQVEQQVRQQVGQQVRQRVGRFVWPWYDGNFMSSYDSFYDFIFSELIECDCKPWPKYRDTSRLSLMYPLGNFCILCQKPKQINIRNDVLHKDGGPSVAYADNFNCWSLNGIAVEQWLAETKAEEIDPAKIMKIANAEVRREFVRKVGIDRICFKLKAKCLNKVGDYELLVLKIENREYRYLKMLNPSIGVWHVEGVPNEIDTVDKALHWRKPEKLRNLPIDDVNGEDYIQQGDVVCWPKNAKSVKSKPLILT